MLVEYFDCAVSVDVVLLALVLVGDDPQVFGVVAVELLVVDGAGDGFAVGVGEADSFTLLACVESVSHVGNDTFHAAIWCSSAIR